MVHQVTDLGAVAARAISTARDASSGRSAETVLSEPAIRAVAMGLTAGSELAEHASPPGATFHVLSGTARLYAADGSAEWVVEAGQVVPIPAGRHGVVALTECAILLTVATTGPPAPTE